MNITKRSTLTGQVNTIDIPITEEQLLQVETRDRPIQEVVPHLSADHREFLMTGITPDEWDKTFGG